MSRVRFAPRSTKHLSRITFYVLIFISIASSLLFSLPSAAGEKYALLVGINKYPGLEAGGRLDLKAPENDVAYLKNILIAEMDFSEKNITTLLSSSNELISQPIATNIASAIESHTRLGRDNLVLFYFSGHGLVYPLGEGGKRYLLPYEAQTGKPTTFIALDQLESWLSNISAQKLIILDACYAGGDKSPNNPDEKAYLELPTLNPDKALESNDENIVVYASAESDGKPQPAYQLPDKERSVFTHYFGEVIKQHQHGILTVSEAVLKTQKAIENDPNYSKHRQQPGLSPEGSDYPLVNRDIGSVTVSLSAPTDRPIQVWIDGQYIGDVHASKPRRIEGLHRRGHILELRDPKGAYETETKHGFSFTAGRAQTYSLRLITGQVTGYVVNEAGNGIAGITVTLGGGQGEFQREYNQAVTSTDGSFTINAAPDTYSGIWGEDNAGYTTDSVQLNGRRLAGFEVKAGETVQYIRIRMKAVPATLHFSEIHPPDATISINGESRVLLPSKEIRVGEGQATITVSHPAYFDYEKTLSLERQQHYQLGRIRLQPRPASLRIAATDGETGEPVDADVVIDGQSHGRTGVEIPVSAGSLNVVVEHPDYEPLSAPVRVSVQPNQQIERRVTLRRKSGLLEVKSNVSGAQIKVDGRPEVRGITPAHIRLPIGNHTISLEKIGYRMRGGSDAITVQIREGVNAPLTLQLEEIPATLIVHTNYDNNPAYRHVMRIDGQRAAGGPPYQVRVGTHTVTIDVYEGQDLVFSKTQTVTAKPGENPVSFQIPPLRPGMIYVEAGEFWMGDTNGPNNQRPRHHVSLDAFFIDRYEVTVGEYERFLLKVHQGGDWRYRHEEQPRTHDHIPAYWNEDQHYPNRPVRGVSWFSAYAYAKSVGKDLPTEAQWEKAASQNPLAIKKYDNHLLEWVADWYDLNFYGSSQAASNPTGPRRGQYRVIRDIRNVTYRNSYKPDAETDPTRKDVFFGFRCAVKAQ